MAFERELHPYGQFSLSPMYKIPADFRVSLFNLSEQVERWTDLQQWKKETIKWAKYPEWLLLVGKLRPNLSFSERRTASQGQSWSWILAHKAGALSTAPAGPDAIMLTLEGKETGRGEGQHLLYPPESPSPSRISPGASGSYSLFLPSLPLSSAPLRHPYPSPSRYNVTLGN